MKKLIVLVSMVVFSVFFLSCGSMAPMGSEDVREHNCTDKIDNDGDGRTDCLDSDCADDPSCETPVLCGNGVIDADEQCDGNALGEATCVTQGFDGGALECTAACRFDLSGCHNNPDPEDCIDELDNDGDGDIDCEDSDCASHPNCQEELCGNAEIDFGEQCDGTNLNGATCVTRGFDRGTLACSVSCQFNTSGCINDPEEDCGNGAIDAGEQCDGANLNGQTCVTRGFDRGTLACTSACRFNTTGCSNDPTVEICDNGIDDNGNGAVDCLDDACWGNENCRPIVCGDHVCDPGEAGVCPEDCGIVVNCGNGAINAGEQCDGSNLNGATCISRGYDGGTLACSSSCTFNVSGCYDNPVETCGNGVLNVGEQCDGSSLNGQTCISRGYDGGTLSCNSNCTFNESSCWDNVVLCGNGVINAGEQCDGSNLNGATCVSRGYTGGTLSCTSSCQFNTSSCYTSPTQVCGNGVKEGTESCDGTDFGGRTCATEGYNSGTLSCSSCILVISGCYNSTGGETVCGDKLDNDGDGLVDFLDLTSCPNNTGLARERNCTDGIDNDSDGRVDCFDHDCSGADVCRRSQASGDNYFVCMPNAGTTDYGCVCSDDLSFWARTTVSGQLTTTTGKVCMGNAKISGDSDYEVGWTRTATCDPTEILRHMDEDGYRDFGVLQFMMVAKDSGALGNMALYVGCSIDPGTGLQTQANIMVVWDRFDANLQTIRNQLFPNGKWLQVYVGSAAYTQLDWYLDYFRPW